MKSDRRRERQGERQKKIEIRKETVIGSVGQRDKGRMRLRGERRLFSSTMDSNSMILSTTVTACLITVTFVYLHPL